MRKLGEGNEGGSGEKVMRKWGEGNEEVREVLRLRSPCCPSDLRLSHQFMECLIIGRDLVRLLQNVARIPEMELVWKDLLHNPQVLSPQFTGTTTLPTILRVHAAL